MGKILFINGHRILQQAVAVSLFPEHEVLVTETIPDRAAVQPLDAVMMDAASTERDDIIAQAARELPNWNVPLIWIERPDASRAPQCERLVVVKTPLEKDALHAAVAESLAFSKPQGIAEAPARGRAADPPQAGAEQAAAGSVDRAGDKEVIELLDVVEGPEVPIDTKAPPGKQ